MVDCFELLFFHTKMYVLLETGGMILAYLGTLFGSSWAHIGTIWGAVWNNLGSFFTILGSFLGLLGQCWDNINCGNPKAPPVENPQIGTHPGGNRKLERTLGGGGHEPQTLVHIFSGLFKGLL